MMERLTEQRSAFKTPIYCNYNKVEQITPPYARTVLARDYKGFGSSNETSNGVIEYK